MNGRRVLLLVGLTGLAFAAAPASASALCNGMAATVAGATGGNDVLTGTAGADVIEGLGGNDTINGGGGNDTICGDADDDTINGGTGDDHLEGGETGSDVDTVTFLGSSVGSTGVTASLLDGTATVFMIEANTLTGFENLTGTDGFDNLTGDNGPNAIEGLDRADNLEGLGGDDTITDAAGGTSDTDEVHYENSPGPGGIVADLGAGTVNGTAAGAGTDTVSGVFGVHGTIFGDTITGDANHNSLVGDSGSDTLVPLAGPDFATGGSGTDTVSYATETGPIVTADLSSGETDNVTAPGGNDTVFQVENLIGSTQNDDITGGSESNVFDGRGGDDDLDGGPGGSDTAAFGGIAGGVVADLAAGIATGQGSDALTNIDNLTGSAQDDFLTGDSGDNAFDGGPGGTDTVRFSGVSQGVTASLATGAATGQGSDTFAGIENLTGSNQDDSLTGDAGPNALSGLDGADNITGGLGADGFFLGAGADTITADDGVIDTIDCEGGGPDSGSVDGPAPAENYITACDSDGDGLIDFVDACPITSATGADGCAPPVVTPPVQTTPTTPAAPAAKQKCKKKKKKHAASAAKKKKCKKKKKR